jgi:hypothetical protein
MARKRQIKKNLKKYGQKTKGRNRRNQRTLPEVVLPPPVQVSWDAASGATFNTLILDGTLPLNPIEVK